MARELNRLTARKAATVTKPGRHADGGGLYLSVAKDGGRKWVFLFRRDGRLQEMGLGSARDVPLAAAREAARQAREQLAASVNPIEARKASRTKGLPPTFDECRDRFLAANKSGWKNEKHTSQWTNTLEAYATPFIGSLPVSKVETGHVTQILDPIWTVKTETASRVRGRIETVLDWAKSRGYRDGENPARWRGHLDKIYPRRSKVRRVRHHAALPYSEMQPFLAALRQREGIAARALEFAILTAARTAEVTHATQGEVDIKSKTWTVPPERMKAAREHRVPLSPQALAVVEACGVSDEANDFLFPSGKGDKPLSVNAMLSLLSRMGRDDLTVHGFRSTFRDWAAETTNFPNEVVEMALAHSIRDKSEAAYRRGDLFTKRAALMAAWATFCEAPPAKVLAIGENLTSVG